MKLELNDEEVHFILQVLGELPTKTGAFVLVQTISEQVKAAQSQSSANAETVATA
jgi:hypothetical protein